MTSTLPQQTSAGGRVEGETARLEARGIRHAYRLDDEWLPVLDDVTIAVRDGEFVTIIGPSGCGKSTLFTILSGLIAPSSGQVLLDVRDVTGSVGQLALMPQKDLLMPWKTVLDNVTIGLELRGVSRKQARKEALGWFGRFGLSGFECQYPSTLSGGMRQRVAFLRTILTGRDVLLLDEPFGALDALTRLDMQRWLLDVWGSVGTGNTATGNAGTGRVGTAVVLITHDIDEAIFLSDRVYVMSPRPGRIVADLRIPFPRPRAHEDLVADRVFTSLKAELLGLLRKDGA
jgi:ABC-type nitrate/sulfonate/bicarbonate transport system ATPase subunit